MKINSAYFNVLQLNSSIIFTLLFLLSVIKPFSIPNANRYMGALLFLIIVLFFLYSLIRQANYKQIYLDYRYEIILLVVYLTISFTSLIFHFDQFEQLSHFIIFSLASFVVFLSGFMLWIIFSHFNHISLRQQSKYPNVLWLLLVFMAVVALWQFLDYPSSWGLTDYFVSADSNRSNMPIISSITRWHTVYGVIVAISILVLLQGMVADKKTKNNQKILIIKALFILFLLFIGLIGESRNFLFSLSVGLLILFSISFKRFPRAGLLILISTIVLVHTVLINNTRALKDYSQILPYLKKIEQKQIPQIRDFIPQINNNTLTDRATLWQQGVDMWKNEPWLGIGPGIYRTVNVDDVQHRNLHNFYFQVLVETGVLGFIAIMGLVLLLIKRAINAKNLPAFGAILASLLFDNYLDYSFPWVIMMVWLLKDSLKEFP